MAKPPFLVVGLGNPGDRYARTRHNAGFIAAQHIAALYDAPFRAAKNLHANIARIQTEHCSLIIAMPTTFMNNSGTAVQAICAYYKIPLTRLIVVHDESDLSLGTYRIHAGRGAAGHNGVADIIAKLSTKDFLRARIGVRPDFKDGTPRLRATEFVLKNFSAQERDILDYVCAELWHKEIAHRVNCTEISP